MNKLTETSHQKTQMVYSLSILTHHKRIVISRGTYRIVSNRHDTLTRFALNGLCRLLCFATASDPYTQIYLTIPTSTDTENCPNF